MRGYRYRLLICVVEVGDARMSILTVLPEHPEAR